jgi:hypothetical protein
LRPLEVTFPFTGIGARFWAAIVRRELTRILGDLAMRADHNTPINGYFWGCLAARALSNILAPRKCLVIRLYSTRQVIWKWQGYRIAGGVYNLYVCNVIFRLNSK